MIFENCSKLSIFFPFECQLGLEKITVVHFLKRYDEISIKIQTPPPPPPFQILYRIANIFYNAQQSIYFLTYDTLKINAFNSQKSIVTSYIAATIIFLKIDIVFINIFVSTMRYITLVVFQLFVIELTSLPLVLFVIIRRVFKMQTNLFLRLSNTLTIISPSLDILR